VLDLASGFGAALESEVLESEVVDAGFSAAIAFLRDSEG
jgi:hypothetical protein